MEASTLTSPQRRLSMVQPIQKSLSLPSYARASGEGIDHKLIFAALEQKERVRRKSKIFRDKEKTGSRQNYFCLPLSSKARCRETSLSSDTSCSSLEFQKPKVSALKSKKNGPRSKDSESNCEQHERDRSKSPPRDEPKVDLASSNNLKEPMKDSESLVDGATNGSKICETVLDTPRATIGSSDSLERTERSSRSSTDSLSRRGRLEAVKARVEAEREKKYADSSSDEDTSSKSTKQNSDGTAHRTVRDVKSKSSLRTERYSRRKSQDETSLKKAFGQRCISSGISNCSDKDFTHSATSFACAEGYCGKLSPTVLEYKIKASSCHSMEERLSTNFSSLDSQTKFDSRLSREDMYSFTSPKYEDSLDFILSNIQEVKKSRKLLEKSKKDSAFKAVSELNFLPKSSNEVEPFVDSCLKEARLRNVSYNASLSHAPTPPPRSPKSMVFFNKAFHNLQNKSVLASTSSDWREMNNLVRRRTQCFSPECTSSLLTDLRSVPDDKFPSTNRNSSCGNKSFIGRRHQESLNPRRKTCSNFSGLDEINFNVSETIETKLRKYVSDERVPTNPDIPCRFSNSSLLSKSCESSKYPALVGDRDKVLEWGESLKGIPFLEKKSNSLENKMKSDVSSWIKWRCLPRRKVHCKCGNYLKSKFECECKGKNVLNDNTFWIKPNEPSSNSLISSNIKSENSTGETPVPANYKNFSSFRSESFSRLSKSEANLVTPSENKNNSSDVQENKVVYHSNTGLSHEAESKLEKSEDINAISEDGKTCNESFNLDTAMEELENVYRSLKYSSENLLEGEEGANVLPNKITSKIYSTPLSENVLNHKNLHLKKYESPHSSLNETLSFTTNTFVGDRNNKKDLGNKTLSEKNFNPEKDIKTSSLSKSLCIDELFENLTLQLDREQKMLSESKNKKGASQRLHDDLNFGELNQHMRSKISLGESREELNVVSPKPKNSAGSDVEKTILESTEKEEPPIPKQRGSSRRKHKATRSYSANLSYLVKSVDDATLSDTASLRTERPQSIAMESQYPMISANKTGSNIRTGNDGSVCIESKMIQPSVLDKIIYRKRSDDLPVRKRPDKLPLQNSGQIWEVRVSMDCPPNANGVLERNSKSQVYSRLHSALTQSNTDAKVSKGHHMEEQQQQLPAKVSSATPLDDAELEKLLNTLLSDVSKVASSVVSPREKKDASQISKRVDRMHPVATRTGETRTMQPVEVIGLDLNSHVVC